MEEHTPPRVASVADSPEGSAAPPAIVLEPAVSQAGQGTLHHASVLGGAAGAPAPAPVGCVPPTPILDDVQPAPAALTLTTIVREAIDAYGMNLARVRRYVSDNASGHSWSDAALERVYAAERERRARLRAASYLNEKLHTLSAGDLRRQAISAGRHVATLRQRGDGRWRWWNWYSGQLEAEIERREAAVRPTGTGTRAEEQQQQAERREEPATLLAQSELWAESPPPRDQETAEPTGASASGVLGRSSPIDFAFVHERLVAGDAVSLQAIRVHCVLHHLDGRWPAPVDEVIARALGLFVQPHLASTERCALE
jgi:hypothetical protein